MNQAQFNLIIQKKIAEFWAARGRTVGPNGVDGRWPCETVDLQRSNAPLHAGVDIDQKNRPR